MAGRPEEYLGDDGIRFYSARWSLPPESGLERFLDSVLRAGTTENGVFSVKIHWYQVPQIERALRQVTGDADRSFIELLSAYFPEPRFILLHRADKIRQAISWYRASQTGLWWTVQEPDGSVRTSWGVSARPEAGLPDLSRIHTLLEQLGEHERGWRRIFTDADVFPLELTYEALAADLPEHLRSVLAHLGQSNRPPGLEAPRLRRLADATTDEWVHRYVAWRRIEQPGSTSSSSPGYVQAAS